MSRVPDDAPQVLPADIERAATRIGSHVRTTPVLAVAGADFGLAHDVTLKLELLQHAGSFKPRGAFNRIITALEAGDVPASGVVAASGGNHGAAVAYAARALGLTAEIFVPSSSPTMKRDRIADFGATVRVIDGLYDDAQAAADVRQAETGALIVHPFDHADVVAGQGTMARELEAQIGPFDTLVAATGGGGFVAGQAAWLQDRVRVVSVEPDDSQCLAAAVAAGEPVPVTVGGVASDSLGAKQLGAVAWSVVRHHVDLAVTVPDDAIRAAQRALWDRLRLVAEPGGATALAALRTGAYAPAPGERVVVVVCGSNCDPATVL